METASTAAGALAAEAGALVDSLALEFGSALLQDEQMQALVRSPTRGRAARQGPGGSSGSGGGLSGSGDGGGGAGGENGMGGLFGLTVGLLGGGSARSPKRSIPPGAASGSADPTADGRGVTSADAVAAAAGAAGGAHQPGLLKAMEEIAAEEFAFGESAAAGQMAAAAAACICR